MGRVFKLLSMTIFLSNLSYLIFSEECIMSLTYLFLLTTTLSFLAMPVMANDIVNVDPNFARTRTLEVKVTPMGLVVDFNRAIASVNLSHQRNFVFSGMDGALCQSTARCPQDASPPTKLLLKRIKPINFKHETATPKGKAMLFVTTRDGQVYRLELEPSQGTPPYTQVEYNR
ncbi:hypothetical protein cce_5022 [Crocosphaera subtropica ATCC 51142]|uniref:Uncharacterized protein n=2 Tax=Crocosphaera TaxID=263510 RepID=B1X2K7_CROS5|nr:hypothetical protein cce_5022 [Crocosphaera subtropica ATCC 51142]